MTSEPPTSPQDTEAAAPPRRFPRSRVNAESRGRLARAVREVDFPMALRGYDRDAVDRYVKEVNRVIAELEITSSPEAAIRNALDEVSEETRERDRGADHRALSSEGGRSAATGGARGRGGTCVGGTRGRRGA